MAYIWCSTLVLLVHFLGHTSLTIFVRASSCGDFLISNEQISQFVPTAQYSYREALLTDWETFKVLGSEGVVSETVRTGGLIELRLLEATTPGKCWTVGITRRVDLLLFFCLSLIDYKNDN